MKRGREYGDGGQTEEIEYEKLRNERLAENRKRMEELGLVGLSHSLAESARTPSARSSISSTPRSTPRVLSAPVGPSRRSSRLQGGPVVSYAENMKKEGVREKSAGRRASEAGTGGFQPEVYTEEHEKLLGSAEKEWQLFTDGYNSTGARIYDPVRGKTCHQCRQKTMGHRTWCSSCESLHGQFCGDCLYMRYGENVLETKENKNWTCPVCRKICNCSFCRLRRGWTPTGALYKRIKSLGYKSVAHYLVLTRRGGEETEVEAMPKDGNLEVKKTPKKEKVKESPAKVEEATLTPKEEKSTVANMVKQENTNLVTPKPDLEKPDTPDKEQEVKAEVLTANETTSSEDGEGGMRTRRSRRSLNYVPPSKLKSNANDQLGNNIEIPSASMAPEGGDDSCDVEPVKRGRGRPRKYLAPKKSSFYASAPKAKTEAKPEPEPEQPVVTVEEEAQEEPVVVLDSSDTDDMKPTSASSRSPSSTLTIAQRLQRRRLR